MAREAIWKRCLIEPNVSVMFLESICDDPQLLARNMRLKLSGPDYANIDPEVAMADFQKRVKNYEKAYESISDEEELKGMQYSKLINVGRKVSSSPLHYISYPNQA